jgi:hypothetical protein
MLTNLASGPLIGFPRVMALTQWLGRPASDFVRARSKSASLLVMARRKSGSG